MDADSYTRVVSKEEEKEGFLFVPKNRLAFFPLAGQTFDLVNGMVIRKVAMESYPCECRGPEEPHRHYFIRWEGLKEGDQITVRRDQKKAGRYLMQVRSKTARKELCG